MPAPRRETRDAAAVERHELPVHGHQSAAIQTALDAAPPHQRHAAQDRFVGGQVGGRADRLDLFPVHDGLVLHRAAAVLPTRITSAFPNGPAARGHGAGTSAAESARPHRLQWCRRLTEPTRTFPEWRRRRRCRWSCRRLLRSCALRNSPRRRGSPPVQEFDVLGELVTAGEVYKDVRGYFGSVRPVHLLADVIDAEVNTGAAVEDVVAEVGAGDVVGPSSKHVPFGVLRVGIGVLRRAPDVFSERDAQGEFDAADAGRAVHVLVAAPEYGVQSGVLASLHSTAEKSRPSSASTSVLPVDISGHPS